MYTVTFFAIFLIFCAGLCAGVSGMALVLYVLNREQEAYWEPAEEFAEDPEDRGEN